MARSDTLLLGRTAQAQSTLGNGAMYEGINDTGADR